MMSLSVDHEVLAAIRAASASTHPNEACGLLFGTFERNGAMRIHTALPVGNVHPSPLTHFEIDPAALLAAHRNARTGGPSLVGYFHSHPTGHPRPSATDCEHSSGDGLVWAIAAGDDVTFWRDGDNGFEALSTTVIDA